MALRKRNRGLATIWTVMIVMTLAAFFGLAVDVLYVTLAAQQLYVGADASALAGAARVRQRNGQDAARVAATDIAASNEAGGVGIQLQYNGSNAVDGDIVVGRYDRPSRSFTPIPPGSGLPNAVRVNARRTSGSLSGQLGLLFGPIFGVATADVNRAATAIVGGYVSPGMVILDVDDPCSFQIRGSTATLQVDGGLYVNSEHDRAACNSGPSQIQADEVYVRGGTSSQFDQVQLQDEHGNPAPLWTDVKSIQPPYEDPLAYVPDPVYDPTQDLGEVRVTGGQTVVLPQAPATQHYDGWPVFYYGGGIDASSGRVEIAESGIYVLDGTGLSVTGQTSFVVTAPQGAMFYIVGDGSVNLVGTGEVQLVPLNYPSNSDNYMSLFQARDNLNDATINGTANFVGGGTMYFKNNHLSVGGTSSALSDGLITNTVEIHGTGEIGVGASGFPNVGRFLFLVE